jgi:predicted transglutaminase-like cysteine proteinase
LPRASQLPATTVAKPIPAWIEFCRGFPAEECRIDLREPATIKLTTEIWSTIRAVNSRVNASIIPITDYEQWGVPADMQLLKRKLLAERGLPRRAMRMTVVIDARSDGHAVLMLRTDRGDFILDNETDAILPWDRTAYVFAKREGHDGTAWVSLGQAASPVATANH